MGLKDSRDDVERMLNTASLKTDEEWRLQEYLVKRWLDDFKQWEQRDTFEKAFSHNRMTIRGMGVEAKHREAVNKQLTSKGTPKAADYVRGAIGTFSRPESNIKDMRIYYGIKGIQERANPENFQPEEVPKTPPKRDFSKKVDPNARPFGWSKKYWLGLHDLSASLLRGDWPIPDQQKYYSNSTWVFMPVPKEEDLVLFNSLNFASRQPGASAEFRKYVRMIASQITRIAAAQAEDMHTTYVDTGGLHSLYPKQGKIKYGLGGYPVGGWNEDPSLRRSATAEEIAQRKLNALSYKTMLNECVRGRVNEIVMKYRCHGDGRTAFPMFATQATKDSDYVVIDKETVRPTSMRIRTNGTVYNV
jgi:hypothetical protein